MLGPFPVRRGEKRFPCSQSYTLKVKAFADGDPTHQIGGVTATFTILPDAAYTVSGTAPSASGTIKDLPMDEWRFASFTTAELLDPAISGDLSDAESDGLRNLQEYAFVRPPKTQDTAPAVPVLLIHPSTSALHLGLVYARRKDALDLIFDTEISDVLTAWRTARKAAPRRSGSLFIAV